MLRSFASKSLSFIAQQKPLANVQHRAFARNPLHKQMHLSNNITSISVYSPGRVFKMLKKFFQSRKAIFRMISVSIGVQVLVLASGGLSESSMMYSLQDIMENDHIMPNEFFKMVAFFSFFCSFCPDSACHLLFRQLLTIFYD